MFKRFVMLIILGTFISACGAGPTPEEVDPGDAHDRTNEAK